MRRAIALALGLLLVGSGAAAAQEDQNASALVRAVDGMGVLAEQAEGLDCQGLRDEMVSSAKVLILLVSPEVLAAPEEGAWSSLDDDALDSFESYLSAGLTLYGIVALEKGCLA